VRLNGAFGAGSQFASLVLTRTIILKVEIEGTIRVVLERHPAAHGEPIQDVPNLKAICVVERDRPEGADRRLSAFLEVNRVPIRPIERLAVFIAEIQR
jgi:hypothetical protein